MEATTPTPEVTPPATLVAGVRVGGGSLRTCGGVAGACVVANLAGVTLEVVLRGAAPPDGPWRAEVTPSRRTPGSSAFVAAPARSFAVAAGATSVVLPASALVRGSGTSCLRVRAVTAAETVGAPGLACIRLRPRIEIGWAGDIVIGSSYGLPPLGGRTQLAKVHRLLRAPDLMIGNYEGTLSRGGSPRCGGGALCYIFQAPPERARNLATAGFDVMNLANNHALDMGAAARRQTVAALARHGIETGGLPGRVIVQQVEDTKVAIVGISQYPGSTTPRDPAAVRRLVRAADRAGDVVVVAFHGGLEGARGAHVPRGSDYGIATRRALHAAVDAGADVVLGSGPHVVRGVERYRGAFIVYSSGNFAGWRNFGLGGLSSQSGVVRMSFDHRGATTSATWDGVIIDGPGIPRPDRSGAVVRRVASLSRQDFGRAGARFTRAGSFR